MKCFGKLTYSMAAYVDDLAFRFKILQRATEYGVDSFSTPQIMAFAVELYEAGILTDKDFEGCPSDKEGRFFWLLDRIVRREGIGDILADGVYYAAERSARARKNSIIIPSRSMSNSPSSWGRSIPSISSCTPPTRK